MRVFQDPYRKRSNNAAIGLVVSLLVHGILFWYRSTPSMPEWQKELEQSAPIEITDIPPDVLQKLPPPPATKLKNQIVDTQKAKNQTPPPDTRFAGEQNQTVEQQTIAQKTDVFTEGTGTGPKGAPEPQKADSEGDTDSIPDSPNGIGVRTAKKKKVEDLTFKDLGISGDGGIAGATSDYIKDVATGSRTVLSTREFKFSSYYNRIKRMLVQHWRTNLNQKLTVLWGKGTKIRKDELRTRVQVLIKEDGTILKIRRLASSGFVDIDTAAVEAFNMAAPFPNPPNGIVDADGFARIQWDFILQLESAPTIQFQSGRVQRY